MELEKLNISTQEMIDFVILRLYLFGVITLRIRIITAEEAANKGSGLWSVW